MIEVCGHEGAVIKLFGEENNEGQKYTTIKFLNSSNVTFRVLSNTSRLIDVFLVILEAEYS